MMTKSINQRKSKNRGRRNGNRRKSDHVFNGPPASAIEYNGPSIPRVFAMQRKTNTELMIQETGFSSDAGGLMTTVFGSSPSAASNWSGWQSCYDEFRTLALTVQYVPNDRYNRGVSVFTAPLSMVCDMDNSGSLASYTQAAQYGSDVFKSLDTPWKIHLKMSGVTDAQWSNTSPGTTSFFWIKCYAAGLTASTQYGLLLIYRLVEFRGAGI